jgi:hypothetical protein
MENAAFLVAERSLVLTDRQRRNIAWPICTTPENFRTQSSNVSFLPSLLLELMERHQPFHEQEPEDAQLALLLRLDNEAKHRALHLAAMTTSSAPLILPDSRIAGSEGDLGGPVPETGGVFLRINYRKAQRRPAPVVSDPELRFCLVLDGRATVPIVDLASRMAIRVDALVSEAEALIA